MVVWMVVSVLGWMFGWLLVCWDGLLVCLFVHQMSFDKSEPIERCKTLNLETLSFRSYIADLTFFHYTILNPKTIAKRNRPIPNN
jgi:hypothetical protein